MMVRMCSLFWVTVGVTVGVTVEVTVEVTVGSHAVGEESIFELPRQERRKDF